MKSAFYDDGRGNRQAIIQCCIVSLSPTWFASGAVLLLAVFLLGGSTLLRLGIRHLTAGQCCQQQQQRHSKEFPGEWPHQRGCQDVTNDLQGVRQDGAATGACR